MRKIFISDVTMKITEQNGKNTLSFKEKIEMAKLLDRVKVDVIELCAIKNKKIDSLLVKSVADAVSNSIVALPVGQTTDSVDEAWAALKGAKHPRLQVVAPMSIAQMEYFWHKKPDKMIAAVRELIAKSREYCADVEFIADDACRSDREFLCSAVTAAIEAGATGVTLCDAAGLMFPDEFAEFVTAVREAVPALEGVRLGVMCMDGLSMAGACAAAAVKSGAEEVKTSSCGDGVTRLDEFSAILQSRNATLDADCGLRHSEVKRITGQVKWMCRADNSKNSPFAAGVSGENAASDMVLSVHDDRAAVLRAVEKLGYDLSEEDAVRVCEAFERIAANKNTVSARELETIVASAAMQVPATYHLENYVINCGSMFAASAHIRLTKDGENLEGVCLGDGPIDAAFLALEQIIGRHYELDDFQIQSVTEGREAMGEAIVRLRSGSGRVYAGRGISTDVVGASIGAYVNALNKIVYEEA